MRGGEFITASQRIELNAIADIMELPTYNWVSVGI